MRKWRYLVVNLFHESEKHWISFQEILNAYKMQGLELVSIVKDDFLQESAGSLLLILKEYYEE
jgi:hypothetical protein